MNSYQYNRNLDSHMTKNIEWGAVAYLSHSDYGINKNVNINNNSAYLTGYSAAEGANQDLLQGQTGTRDDVTQKYNTERGYLASTTGNITGVYDMGGGTHEFVAAYMDGYGVKSSGGIASGFSDDDLVTYEKYLDKYGKNSHGAFFKNRKIGDATGEMGPFYLYNGYYSSSWYNAHSVFISPDLPWFGRSGNVNFGTRASQFYFSRYSGSVNSIMTFRLVLSP